MRYLADRSPWRAARVSLFVTMARSTRRPGNLPAEASSFIGRRRELAELRKKLAGARLVCLAGPGGVGKTRLAVRGATDLARGFAGGAWMVELAQVQDPALVGNAVMAALDLRDQTATEPLPLLCSYLQDKELLLVVDNCEHLLEAAAQLVTEVIRAAPGVRVIATSREPLSVSGEHVVPVPPLELPAAVAAETVSAATERGGPALHGAGGGGIGQLRADRLEPGGRRGSLPPARRTAAGDRARGGQNASPYGGADPRPPDRPVQSADGGSRAALPRHQTLRTTIDWSHDLLEAAERALLRRLGVFAGRFTLEDVESVCASDDVPAAAHWTCCHRLSTSPW